MGHELVEFEEDFSQGGAVAVCKCGWRSVECVDIQEAESKRVRHALDERPCKSPTTGPTA